MIEITTTGETTVGVFLDALAARQSTPGGGGAAAVTGSQAAALVSMVANFTLGSKKYADVEEEMSVYLKQSEALRSDLLELAAPSMRSPLVTGCRAIPTKRNRRVRTLCRLR